MKSKDIIVKAENIEFSFLLQNQGVGSIKQYFLSLGTKNMFQKKEVLRGINLEVFKGESLALMGRNGSGKSTFLRVLAGIIAPDKGKMHVYGRVAPVMALGVGFELEMTGIENIKLLGSLMGKSKKEINYSLDYIKEFSELGESIEMQVKRYSSGMMSRLGFSIATSGTPDILIIDEALAVGDKGFQDKCLNRIQEIQKNGGTLIFVSHNLEEVQRLCTRAAFLNNGVIEKIGDIEDVGKDYLELFH
jgi:ABC-2 type transport system ATP-binding protein